MSTIRSRGKRPGRFLRVGWMVVLLAASSCQEGPSPADAIDRTAKEGAAQQAHIDSVVAAGGVVDSVLPVAELLQRFQAGLSPTDTLRHASPSPEQLVDRLVRAIASHDTMALNAMVLDRAEFAFLYYPGSSMSLPPYEAPPALLWGQILAASDDGAGKLLARLGGRQVSAHALRCPPPKVEGANRLLERCTVRFDTSGARALEGNLFGTILTRDGRSKFISLANRI